jgi:hypothetical protein
MNRSLLMAPALAALAALSLAACDRPVVVNPPPVEVATPGPAGPAGATGEQGTKGTTGSTGDAGKAGESTTVIVMPNAASAATN